MIKLHARSARTPGCSSIEVLFFGYHSSNDQVTCCGYLYLVRLRLYAEEDNKDKASASSAADAAAEPDFCGGEFRYPRTCGGSSDCEYTARWEINQ